MFLYPLEIIIYPDWCIRQRRHRHDTVKETNIDEHFQFLREMGRRFNVESTNEEDEAILLIVIVARNGIISVDRRQ